MFKIFNLKRILSYRTNDEEYLERVRSLKGCKGIDDSKYDQNKKLLSIQRKMQLLPFEGSTEAGVETDIEPGIPGRVFYQGTYWRAYCDSKTL